MCACVPWPCACSYHVTMGGSLPSCTVNSHALSLRPPPRPPRRPALPCLHARPGAAARLPLPPGPAATRLPARHDLLRHLQPGLQAAAGDCGAHASGRAATGGGRRRRARGRAAVWQRRRRQARARAASCWWARQGRHGGPRWEIQWRSGGRAGKRRGCGAGWSGGQQGKRRRTSWRGRAHRRAPGPRMTA